MTNLESSTPSFLKDAFVAYAQYSASQKQDVQKAALKWLQLHINNDLADKTILEQFAQKWRKGSNQPLSAAPLYLESLPRSYKGKKSVSGHQEEALSFLQEVVPLQMQEDFKQRWNLKAKLQVSSSDGATFKVDQQEMTLLKQNDADGDGTAWYQIADNSLYYLLSYEEKGDDYLVELGEEISPQNQNTWFVAKEHVKISSI
ncbi:MAG: hypothetical protein AAGF01_31780 [Cyanobacteria bacterium P01_G01_bin.38]